MRGARLERIGWSDRETALREESLALVCQHWSEIEAVARELLQWRLLDDTEVELIADAAAGDDEADVAEYRQEVW